MGGGERTKQRLKRGSGGEKQRLRGILVEEREGEREMGEEEIETGVEKDIERERDAR